MKARWKKVDAPSAANESTSAAVEAKPELMRSLGLFDTTMLVMGSVIATSIFVLPHAIARQLGAAPVMLAAWALGGVITVLGALIFAELAQRLPRAGGVYVYLREAYHPALAFLYGWSLLLVVQTGAMASVAVIFARYFIELTHAPVSQWVVTTVAILSLTIINCAGVRTGSRLQSAFMVTKIAAIVTLIAAGLFFVDGAADGAAGMGSVATNSRVPSGVWQLAGDFGAAMVLILFSYGGAHMSTFISGEVREPRKTLPRGLILGVSGVVALYLGVNLACLSALGAGRLADTAAPATELMRLAFGERGAQLIAIGIGISALGYLSQATLTTPRVYYAMARDRLFFKSVAWLHPKTRAPVAAILLQGALAAIIAVSGRYEQILNYVMSSELIFIALTAASVFLFRRRRNESGGNGYKAQVHPLMTGLFIAVQFAVALNLFYRFPINSMIGAGIVLAGIPVYLIWRRLATD